MERIGLSGYGNSQLSTVGSLTANLPEMLGQFSRDPQCLVAVVDFMDERYVQFWADTDGSVIIEVISNENIGSGRKLSPEDERHLRKAGWRMPSKESGPNWRVKASGNPELIRAILMAVSAIYCVLREIPNNIVKVRSWAMSQSFLDSRERSHNSSDTSSAPVG